MIKMIPIINKVLSCTPKTDSVQKFLPKIREDKPTSIAMNYSSVTPTSLVLVSKIPVKYSIKLAE